MTSEDDLPRSYERFIVVDVDRAISVVRQSRCGAKFKESRAVLIKTTTDNIVCASAKDSLLLPPHNWWLGIIDFVLVGLDTPPGK